MARAHRRHVVRVAAITTLLVMACYTVAAVVVNAIVTHHLIADVDARLSDRIEDVRPHPTPEKGSIETPDLDDAPSFLWSISSTGAVTPLTQGAPKLPASSWDSAPVSLPVGSSTFRFDSVRLPGETLVAGQSIANASNIQTTLLLAEIAFGAVLAVAVFCGAIMVGLRAAAPSELVRRRQAEFTADASHELRTPIAVIEAEVDLALDRPRDPIAYRDILERVGQESSRLRRIVEDLLWLARADDEPVPADALALTDVAGVADSCVQRFGPVAATNDVALTIERVGPGPFTVQASESLIERLAGVLIDNACKFAGEGGRVEVSVRCVGNRVTLRVDDSGPGIPDDQREAVFDRFHRANDATVGTGLGLAIADAVIRSTQGTWDIGVAELGGARMEASWRRTVQRQAKSPPATEHPLTDSLT
ncbi:MAG TPA: HAMP domain-containing sensor histidine kinase [Vicinamibacterales bacterium]|nr:HAMP domain-containing sensor histidine kinase [Vicinamibacterales bacterium]